METNEGFRKDSSEWHPKIWVRQSPKGNPLAVDLRDYDLDEPDSAGDANELSSAMGPSRMVSRGHASQVIRHLSKVGDWIRESSASRGDSMHYRITKRGASLGKVMLVWSSHQAKDKTLAIKIPKISFTSTCSKAF